MAYPPTIAHARIYHRSILSSRVGYFILQQSRIRGSTIFDFWEGFSLLAKVQLQRLTVTLFVLPWIGGHLRSVIMVLVAGAMLPSSMWILTTEIFKMPSKPFQH
ncbi:hypothetical protein L1987_38224 [Smallanthus sonchifolius]|uniref:Uncharacterized protein n=1 Tax=Smallanthus sonchifolius TaxID=185202 RepID=A0ACB9HIE0_9ASTR|nr:hypothetical protein L1987_38224 [Smallanthus sonchifolius]